MRNLYYFKKKVVSDGATVMKIETDPVKDGRILRVDWISGYHDNQAVTEATHVYLKSGETQYDLRTLVPTVAGYPAGRRINVLVAATMQVGVYFPSVANTEYMYLTVLGEYISMEGGKRHDVPGNRDRSKGYGE